MTRSRELNELSDAAKAVCNKAFAGVIKVVADSGEALWIDGRSSPPAISFTAFDTPEINVWRGANDTLQRIFEGERSLESAFVAGRVFVSGDMSIMSRLEMSGER